jgi:hypothetical protein
MIYTLKTNNGEEYSTQLSAFFYHTLICSIHFNGLLARLSR